MPHLGEKRCLECTDLRECLEREVVELERDIKKYDTIVIQLTKRHVKLHMFKKELEADQ